MSEKFIYFQKETEVRARETSTCHVPYDPVHGVKDFNIPNGVLVDSIPDPVNIVGKSAILYINPQTKEMWYEYTDIPKTPEQLMEERLASIEIAMAQMLGI